MRTTKIKKVDDKPMIIHTKQKTRIHSHKPKKSSIKGANIYTVDRGSKAKKSVHASSVSKKYRMISSHRKKELTIAKRHRTSNESIKIKASNLRNIGIAGAKQMADQVEGGKEIQQASYLAYEAARPVAGTAYIGAAHFKRKAAEQSKKKIKKVNSIDKLSKSSMSQISGGSISNTIKSVDIKRTEKMKKRNQRSSSNDAVKLEHSDVKRDLRMRKIKFFLDKMKSQDEQTDSFAKLVKDIMIRKGAFVAKRIMAAIAPFILILVLLVSMIAVPVVGVVGIMYNSPFSVFLPPLEAGDTVVTVATAYVSEFNNKVQTEANNHTGADEGRIVYVDYEGSDAAPTNLYDIIVVYMVKYGVGETASVMNDTSKGWLKGIVNEMCTYTTSISKETEDVDDGHGGTTQVTKKYLNVNVSLKTWRDMVTVYGFGADEQQMLTDFMSVDNLSILGYVPAGGGGGDMQSLLSDEEIAAILSAITDPKQRAACDYALHRVGYPYSQTLRDSGNYYDCSSLAYYSWKNAGVNISYGDATSAAAEAQGLFNAKKTVKFAELQPGDLIFYSTSTNGRFKNITHVAVYVGNGKVVEALNEKYGVVYQNVRTGHIVMMGRPS